MSSPMSVRTLSKNGAPPKPVANANAEVNANANAGAGVERVKSASIPTLGRSAAVMGAGTLLSRLTGIARNVLLFRILGPTLLGDAYTNANTTPNMIYELVAGGVLSALLVPLFNALTHKSTRRARDGIDALVTVAFVVLIATAIAVAVGAPQIMWLYLDKPRQAMQRQLGTQLLRMFAPQIVVYGFITLATAALNTKRRFGAAMFAPVCNNLVMIGVLAWAARLLDKLRNPQTTSAAELQAVLNSTQTKLVLGFGTTAGVLAMGLILIPALREARVGWRWHWEPRHPAVIELLRLSGWTAGYVAANQAALLFIQNKANDAMGPKGGGATLYSLAYATFFLLPHGLFAVSIMTALQPELSTEFLRRSRRQFRKLLAANIANTLTLMVPSAVGLFVLAMPITSLFSGGRTNVKDANQLGAVLRAMVLGLPAFSVYLLLMNALKAMRDTKATFTVNATECAINVGLAYGFLRAGYGVVGLGLAFAFAYLIAVFLALHTVSVRTNGIHGRALTRSALRIACSGAAMGVAVLLASLGTQRLVHSTLGPRITAITQIGIGVGVGVTVYVVVGRAIGVTELDAALASIGRRLRRKRSTN